MGREWLSSHRRAGRKTRRVGAIWGRPVMRTVVELNAVEGDQRNGVLLCFQSGSWRMRASGRGVLRAQGSPPGVLRTGCRWWRSVFLRKFDPDQARQRRQSAIPQPTDTTRLIVANSNEQTANWGRIHQDEFHPRTGVSIRVRIINPAWQQVHSRDCSSSSATTAWTCAIEGRSPSVVASSSWRHSARFSFFFRLAKRP